MNAPISLDDARRLLLDGYCPLGTETVPLRAALGRILAEPVVAHHDQPPAPVSAMDGYAVRAADAQAGARLRIIGESPAGAPFSGSVGAGECVRIATGGIVPEGADRIIIQELVSLEPDAIVLGDVSGPSFVRLRGNDFCSGQQLLSTGRRIDPAVMGLIAAAGVARVVVRSRPRVAVLAGGDELREPGHLLAPGAVYNSAAFSVSALVEQWGGVAVRSPIIRDDRDCVVAAIRDLESVADLFVPLGGASVGHRDLFRPAFDAIGAKERFWRINVAPGKPCWHSRLEDGRPVLGLPGNPSSAFVCAHLLLRPLMDALVGSDPESSIALQSATLTHPLSSNGPREAWLRATVTLDADGLVRATVDDRQDSSLQTPLANANALVLRSPDAGPCATGSLIQFLRISS